MFRGKETSGCARLEVERRQDSYDDVLVWGASGTADRCEEMKPGKWREPGSS